VLNGFVRPLTLPSYHCVPGGERPDLSFLLRSLEVPRTGVLTEELLRKWSLVHWFHGLPW
jgi:hypothetical protein